MFSCWKRRPINLFLLLNIRGLFNKNESIASLSLKGKKEIVFKKGSFGLFTDVPHFNL